MRQDLDDALLKDFPLLFKDYRGPKHITCMHWGFAIPDEWEPRLRRHAEKLEPLIEEWIKDHPGEEDHPRAAQVKSKFNQFCLYLEMGTDAMYEAMREDNE